MFTTITKKYIASLFVIAVFYFLLKDYIDTKQQLKQQQQKYQVLQLQLADNQQKIDFYYQQSVTLNEQLNKLTQQAEQRENELQTALKRNQNWANEPVPDDIIRLFNARNRSH